MTGGQEAPAAAPALPFIERGRGRPIVFLHGWSAHAGFFAPQLDGLSDRYHVLAPDLPGHRKAQRIGTPGIEGSADAVWRLLEEERLQDVVLAGWSMGAHVAFDLIRRYGNARIAGLIVIDMTARIMNEGDWRLGISGAFDHEVNRRMLAAMEADWPRMARTFSRRLFAKSVPADSSLVAFSEHAFRSQDPRLLAQAWASLAGSDMRGFLPTLQLPTLVVYGQDGQIYGPDVGPYMVATIPGARGAAIAGAGHAPHLEKPEAFNGAVREFVESL